METKKYIETDNAKKGAIFQIIVFKQGDEEYALSIEQVREVVITPAITKMPQTPSYIKGVANIRGNVIALIDLEEKFNLKQKDNTDIHNFTLVIESEEFKMGILVREVPNTLNVSRADLDESVTLLSDNQHEAGYIKGIIKSNSRMIVLIDIFKVIDRDWNNMKKA
jgi:purine-binding chemotaxis protein CheW